MTGESPTQVVTIGAVAVLVILKCFELLRQRSQRNGHSKPSPALVTKENAPEFWLLQNEMRSSISRCEGLLEDIRDEVMDTAVKRHHRS